MNANISKENTTHFSKDNVYSSVATDKEMMSVEIDATKNQHYSRWSHYFKKDHDRHDDDKFTSASTVINDTKEQHFSLLRTWWSSILGDIYAEDNPKEYSERRKNIIILIVALSGISGPIGSLIYMPGVIDITRDLNTTLTTINGTVSAYVVFMGIAASIKINFVPSNHFLSSF